MADTLHHDGLFLYHTKRGDMWGVRLTFQGKKKSWRGFPDQRSARQFRDTVRQQRTAGRFIPEKYFLANGAELLPTTIEHYLSILETSRLTPAARMYASFWKARFPRSTVNSLTIPALERARQAWLALHDPHPWSNATMNQAVAWLAQVVNHSIARGIATTNPVLHLSPLPVTCQPPPQHDLRSSPPSS